MKALLLAAGEGRRLRPLTRYEPKALIPVLNIPLIEFALSALAEAGVSEVLANTHHLAGRFERWRAQYGGSPPVRLVYEPALLGTGGALRNVAGELGGGSFLIANADVLHGIDLAGALATHRASGALATLVLRSEGWQTAGGFWADPAGRIGGYLAPSEAPPAGMRGGLFTGLHIVEPAALSELPDRGVFCIVGEFYRPLLGRGAPLWAHFIGEAQWRDLGTPGRYLRASLELLGDLGGPAPLAARARALLGEHGYQDDGLLWHRGEMLAAAGPSLIGKGVSLAAGAHVGRCCIVGSGARLDAGARIEQCLLWPGARVPTGQWRERIFFADGRSLEAQATTDPLA